MSADNWAVCPRCASRRESEIAEREASVFDSYGSVPIEDFDRARADLVKFKGEMVENTFREDYEIYGAEEGIVQVVYSGRCTECQLSLKFNHRHPLFNGGV